MLSQKPDLVFVDGHGISHPRRLGVASHFGLMVDVPTIGVAKKRLCGKFEPLSSEPGALAPLMDKGEQLAWVWRSKARCNPLFIATGHRVSVDSALAWVQRCMKGYRLPEPTRWADAVASERPAFVRYTANQLTQQQLRAGNLRREQSLHGAAFPFSRHHQRGENRADDRHDDGHRTGDNEVLANRRRVKPVAGLYINKRFKSLPVVLRSNCQSCRRPER